MIIHFKMTSCSVPVDLVIIFMVTYQIELICIFQMGLLSFQLS